MDRRFHTTRPVSTASLSVGRIGILAVALGIGTAIATGLGAPVAYAETAGSSSSSSGPAHAAASHASTASGTASSSRKKAPAPAATTRRALASPVTQSTTPAGDSSQPSASAITPSPAANAIALVSGAGSDDTPSVPADALTAVGLISTRRERLAAVSVPPSATARASRTATTTATANATAPTTSVELETMALSQSGAGRVVSDSNASSGLALALTSAGSASTTVSLPASTGLVIRARATLGSGAPNMTLSIDGVPFTTIVVKSTSWSDYTFGNVIPAGSHVLSLSTSNSTSQSSLYLDKVTTTTGSLGDEFLGSSGSLPNSRMWNVKSGSGWDPGIETYSSKNVALDGKGHLVIQAIKSNNSYTSGWVETTNKMSLGYGTITARIKVPKGQGLWPAFWLKGADEETNPWPGSGEIDVLELPSTTTTIYSTLHGPISGTTATQQAQVIGNVPDLSTGYHNFWVTHLPDKIIFGVDNVTLGTLTPESLAPGSTWVYNRPMQVMLNLAVGGPWAGAPSNSTKFPAKMYIDSLRWDPVTAV